MQHYAEQSKRLANVVRCSLKNCIRLTKVIGGVHICTGVILIRYRGVMYLPSELILKPVKKEVHFCT